MVKARAVSGGVWSALNEATFTVSDRRLPLRITELMYAPSGGQAYEYIELQNIGTTAFNLACVSLGNGVPVLQALSIVSKTVGNDVIGAEIQNARERVTDGTTISRPLAEGKVLDAREQAVRR